MNWPEINKNGTFRKNKSCLYAYAHCSVHLASMSNNIKHANFKGVRLYTSKTTARGGVSWHERYDLRPSRHLLLSSIERGERICILLLFQPSAVPRRADRSRVARCTSSSSPATMIHKIVTGSSKSRFKHRDSSTIRDDESANISSSGAPLESRRM